VRRHLSLVASTAPFGVGVTGRLVSGYSLLPLPYPGSHGAPTRGGRPARMSFDLPVDGAANIKDPAVKPAQLPVSLCSRLNIVAVYTYTSDPGTRTSRR